MTLSRPMTSGDGPNSYANNSSSQKGGIDNAKNLMMTSIFDKLENYHRQATPFRIADFGCSTGPNTFMAVQNIIDAISLKYKETSQDVPEYFVFFNDFVDNDFNTLFKNMPPSRSYFAAGVPGSFRERLFPKASLDIVHSSYALHWLSMVPKEIKLKNSPAWNEGKIYCAGNKAEVTRAYKMQFQKDMQGFLESRAEELVGGGLMPILMLCMECGEDENSIMLPSETGLCILMELLGDTLLEMVKMGILAEERYNSFNVPVFLPSIRELKSEIKSNNCFTIEKISTWAQPFSTPFNSKIAGTMLRAVVQNLVEEHFGSEIRDQIFVNVNHKIEQNEFMFENEDCKQAGNVFVLLKRKRD